VPERAAPGRVVPHARVVRAAMLLQLKHLAKQTVGILHVEKTGYAAHG
jgi:hypothetical protein